MPASFETRFAQWLTQHGEVRAQGVNVLDFYHSGFGHVYVSDYGEDFEAWREDAVHFVAVPLGFTIDIAGDNFSTEQRIVIRLDNANGAVMDQLRTLTPAQMADEPVVVTYRAYLDTKRNAPAYDPLVLYATKVNAQRFAVEVEASTEPMPNMTAGIRYTLERFPSMAYL